MTKSTARSVPRIAGVAVESPTRLAITWKGGGRVLVDLAGWIATGGDFTAPLKDPVTFSGARAIQYGTAIGWCDGEELAIDSLHLAMLAEQQRPMAASDVAAWQKRMRLSNNEAADVLGVALSTWHAYKTGAVIPTAVQIACRAVERDQTLFAAHYRPRKTGRRKKAA